MLRLIQPSNTLPISYPVNPNASFQPGMIGQLQVIGNNIVLGVSDGLSPMGILDDIKTNAFTAPSIDEIKIASAVGVDNGNGTLVSASDVQIVLDNPNVVTSSFTTNPLDVELIARNGVIVVPAGTPLNFDADGDGTPDSLRTIVSYSYQIPNVPGDDSTQASGKATLWFGRMIFATDMYEAAVRYPLGATLFVSESGLLTTRQPSKAHPGVAMVTGPPSSTFSTLEALWL